MTRLRHWISVIGMAGALACCGRTEPPPPPAKPVETQAAAPAAQPEPAPAVRALPQWRSRLPGIEAAQVPQTLRQADDALARGQLERGSSPGPGALELYLSVLTVDAGNTRALQGVQACLDALFERGRIAMRRGRLADAERIEVIAAALQPQHPDLPVYRGYLTDAQVAQTLVDKAQALAKADKVTEPEGHSALDSFQRAIARVPDFDPAEKGLMRWNRERIQRAWKAARAEDFAAADQYLVQAGRLLPGNAEATVAGIGITEFRQARTQALLEEGNALVDKLQLDRADAVLAHVGRIAAQKGGAEALRERIHLARHYGPFKPAQVFSEVLSSGGPAPEMVVIAYGSFLMGSPDNEAQRQASEGPVHEVRFERGFAMARNEITVADFKRFIDSSGYRTLATRAGHSRVYDEKGGVLSEHDGVDWRRDHAGRIASPMLPVVHVAFEDAQAYAQWLSRQTGQRYRLPSEAEFEYALRGGGSQAYPWGASAPTRLVGNLTGRGDKSQTGRRWVNAIAGYSDGFWGPAPVRTFPEESFGTFDLIGNVSEWTLDCWHESYQRAPADGSAWVNAGCPQRVVRGASWASSLDQARSAYRLGADAVTTTARLGFRVVREL